MWDAIVDGATSSPYWLDLRLYLEELHLANAYQRPLSRGEASSLRPAHNVYNNMLLVLGEVKSEMTSCWPALRWGSRGRNLDRMLMIQLRDHARLAIHTDEGPNST
ncbi:MAG: hypothetical protein M3406_15525 [Chloroflexota bacterium]|nr:hypothetical protein [Chloroflexota bacterium]